jgi:hypothetical protein
MWMAMCVAGGLSDSSYQQIASVIVTARFAWRRVIAVTFWLHVPL